MMDTEMYNTVNDDIEIFTPMNPKEEYKLRKVFDHLCNFQTKSTHNRELLDLKQTMMLNKLKGMTSGVPQPPNNALVVATEQKLDTISREIAALENNPSLKKITVGDLTEKLKELNQKINKKDVEEMIWEVDEDLDQALNWEEFKLMFTRNIADRSGLEPSRMYNLTQFLMYDYTDPAPNCKNPSAHSCFTGLVSVDKTMEMLYERFGRNRTLMEKKLKELFGDDISRETGRGGGEIVEITYDKYVAAVEKVQMTKFWHTTKGKMLNKNGKLHSCPNCSRDDN